VPYIPLAKQRLGKQASRIETVFCGVRAATVAMQLFGKHATIETVFSVWFVLRSYPEDNQRYKDLRVQIWSVNRRAAEAEESPLLRFVTRKHCRGISIVEICYQVKTSESRLRRLSME
jgi:hypothetical protein